MFFAGALPSFLLFDSIVRRIHHTDHSTWEQIGSPGGIFWFPKGARWTTRDKAMFAILYRSADWVPSDPRTRRTITIIRALHVLAILGWSVALAGLIMSEGK